MEPIRFDGLVRSDYSRDGEGGDPAVFFNEHIIFKLLISKGPIRIPSDARFTFEFFNQDRNGKIDWRRPFTTIPAQVDEEELARALEGDFPCSHTVTFESETNAPERFDGWTFFWEVPRFSNKAHLDYVVLDPDGKEHFTCFIHHGSSGSSTRSDFIEGNIGQPSRFFNAPIRFVVRVTEGPMRFNRGGNYYFAFYQKEEDGKIDRQNPFATIKAKVDLEELDAAGTIQPDVDIDALTADRERSSSRSPGSHWAGVRWFQQGKYEACIRCMEHAVAKSPKRNWSWYLLGRSRYELGDYEGALKAFTHLVDICPWSPYHYELGRTLKKLKCPDKAALEFKKSLAALNTDDGYKAFIYADREMEGNKPRSKDEILLLLKGE
jgi:hypothetical protein